MFAEYSDIKISGIATVVPDKVVDNYDCVSGEMPEKKLKKQIHLTGIRKRHVLCDGQTPSDLATMAAKRLLEKLSWDCNDIKALVYVTQVPDLEMPSTALLIQKRLGIGTHCMAFDVNLGCSGYTAGLQIAASLIQQIKGKALLLTSDGMPKREREMEYLLFGCGGTATAVEVSPEHHIRMRQQSDGTRYRTIYREKESCTHMDGNGVFAFTINDVADSILETMDYYHMSPENIDYFVFHQGQKMIIDNLAEICKIPLDKMLYSLHEYGNTSSSSIPLSLCHEQEKLQKKETIRLYMSGFGVGLAWGSVICDIDTDVIMPITESDYHFVD